MRNPTGTQEVMHVSFQVCSKRKQDSPGRRGVRYPQVNSAVHRYSTISGWYPSGFFMSSCLPVQPMFPITRTSFWNTKILSLRCQTEFNEKGEKSPEAFLNLWLSLGFLLIVLSKTIFWMWRGWLWRLIHRCRFIIFQPQSNKLLTARVEVCLNIYNLKQL